MLPKTGDMLIRRTRARLLAICLVWERGEKISLLDGPMLTLLVDKSVHSTYTGPPGLWIERIRNKCHFKSQ
jgi:hypothetical protein